MTTKEELEAVIQDRDALEAKRIVLLESYESARRELTGLQGRVRQHEIDIVARDNTIMELKNIIENLQRENSKLQGYINRVQEQETIAFNERNPTLTLPREQAHFGPQTNYGSSFDWQSASTTKKLPWHSR